MRRADLVDGGLSSTGSISDLVATRHDLPRRAAHRTKKFGTLGDTENGLLIPDDKMAVSVELTDFDRVAGFVNPGSDVAIFAVRADPVRMLPDGTEQKLAQLHPIVLLPKVPVLGVGTSSVSAKTTTTDEGEPIVEEVPRTILTLAVDQEQAEKVIYAARNAEISFALLSEESKVTDGAGVTAGDLLPEIFRAAS